MSTMTREELLGVLNGDQTLDEIEAAISAGELSQDEWGRICDFLRTEDRAQAEQLFDEILQDIDSIPAYDDGKAAVKGWKEYRDEVAYEVKALKLQEIECAQTIARLGNEFDAINQQIKDGAGTLSQEGIDQLKETREQIEGKLHAEYKAQSDMFKRHAALDLMAVEAKDFVKQAEKRVWLEQTEPVRKGIGYVFAGIKLRGERAIEAVQQMGKDVARNISDKAKEIGEKGKEIIDNIKDTRQRNQNTKDLVKSTDDLTFHPIEKLKNAWDISEAKLAWKDANYFKEQSAKAAEKMLKEQNKMLEKAQKLIEKQSRPTFMEKLEAWSKGEKAQPKPHEPINDYEQAKAFLEKNGMLDERKLNGYRETIAFMDKQARMCEREAMQAMERVAERMRDRQQEVQDMQQTFEQMLENGELNHNVDMLNEIQQNLDDAFNMNFIDQNSFDQDMLDMMRENGMGDIIDKEEVEVEGPEFG